MKLSSQIELRNLQLSCQIGQYGPQDVVARAHLLDLTLTIDPSLVLIDADGMDHVFDYDPLVVDIDQLARDGHYDTQERLMTRIVGACARYREIESVDIALRKTPVLGGFGELGVRLWVDAETLQTRRETA